MVDPARPSLFTLPFGQDLCDATVSAIISEVGASPVVLSQSIIFLPNNRAIRTMTEAFVRRAQPGLLLPRMVAVGDLALDEALGPVIDPLSDEAPIPAAIGSMERLLLLAKLLKERHAAHGNALNPNEAIRLARYLAEVIDELEIERIRFSRFDEIKPDGDLAGHWQSSYAQLLEMIPEYNAVLAGMGRLGPAARRNLLLDQLANSLKIRRPKNLIVAAGVSTAAPAVADLLTVIANLPRSLVILPPIDLAMGEEHWQRLGPQDSKEGEVFARAAHETHPQFHLKLLLDRMGFRRDELTLLSPSKSLTAATISQIFCLPDETEHWRDLSDAQKKMPHISLLTAEDSAEEARAVAILVREALEQPLKRIAVVTPDRELAVRISAQLLRWNINVDDSAGLPLVQSPNGSLFMALAKAVEDQFAPVPLLAALKHPLVKSGEGRLDWLEMVRILDLILRGPNEGIGMSAITARIGNWLADQAQKGREVNPGFADWWQSVAAQIAPASIRKSEQFSVILGVLQSVAETLSDGIIWRGEAGRQLSTFLEELNGQDLSAIGALERQAIVPMLSELMSRQAVRAPYGGHPRVAIFGLLEARLQQADFVICCGLNEGSWPQLPQPDPWLAPRIRRELKLAGLERNIGLAAHDLATALGAKQVALTRAKRDRGGPTVASRFLLRIQALLGSRLTHDNSALALARMIETPDVAQKYQKPAPMPDAGQRAVTLSVTDFDRLMADPFAFYANKILNLRPLESVAAQPSYAWRGSVVHDILEHWVNEDDCDPEKLNQRAADLLSNQAVHPALRALWQPRIAEGLRWIAQQTQEMRADGRGVLVAEVKGKTEIDGVKIIGRVDRIDRLPDGRLAIIDYKTGSSPTDAKVLAGFALQLGLIGLIAEDGGIKGAEGEAGAFEYWSLAKKYSNFGNISTPVTDIGRAGKKPAEEFVDFAREYASQAIQRWILGSEPFYAKLHPEYAPYADYDQLMRYEEWNGREPLPVAARQDEAGQ